MSILLETERLLLRPPRAADISHFVPLLDDFEVSKNLSPVPHPYTEDDACAFIVNANHGFATGTDYPFAILIKASSVFIGVCGLHPRGGWQFGYWLGKRYWGKGYATEAAGRVVAFAFDELKTEALRAGWYYDNPASGRVLEKLGFKLTGEAERSCTARGCTVKCHLVELDRAAYLTRKMVS
jgi:[ribosomal protein S5]-alanine N-acetyltransferase